MIGIKKYLAVAFAAVVLMSACSVGKEKSYQMSEQDLKVASIIIDAATQKEIGNIGQAVSLYEQVLSLQPENSLAYYQLAALSYEQQNIASAIEYNEKAIALAPKNHWYRQQLAEIYRQTRQFDKAVRQYETIIKQNPEVDEYYSELADIYMQSAQFEKAIEVINRMEKRHGVSEEMSMFKFRLYKELGQSEKALKEIERLSKEYPQKIDYLSILAQTAVQNKQYDKAFSYFTKIESLAPEDENNTIALIEHFNRAQNAEKTEEYLEKLCQNKNVSFDTKNMVLLSIYQDKVDNDETTFNAYVSHLEGMRELHSEEAVLWQFLNVGYMRRLDFPNAILSGKKVISLGVKGYQVFQNLLIAQSTFNDPEGIIETATQAIELYPQQAIPYLFKGVNELSKGDTKAAIASLTKGLGLSADNKALKEDFNLNLADAYHVEGNNEKAFEHYEKVIQLNPNNFPALNNYAYYLALEGRDLEKAESMAQKVYSEVSDNLTYADTYAWVLYVAGKYEQALEVLEKFTSLKSQWSDTIKQHYEAIKQKTEK